MYPAAGFCCFIISFVIWLLLIIRTREEAVKDVPFFKPYLFCAISLALLVAVPTLLPFPQHLILPIAVTALAFGIVALVYACVKRRTMRAYTLWLPWFPIVLGGVMLF